MRSNQKGKGGASSQDEGGSLVCLQREGKREPVEERACPQEKVAGEKKRKVPVARRGRDGRGPPRKCGGETKPEKSITKKKKKSRHSKGSGKKKNLGVGKEERSRGVRGGSRRKPVVRNE